MVLSKCSFERINEFFACLLDLALLADVLICSKADDEL